MLEYCSARQQHRLSSGLTWSELRSGSWRVISDQQHGLLIYQGRLYRRQQQGAITRLQCPVPTIALSHSYRTVGQGRESEIDVRVLCNNGRQYKIGSSEALPPWPWSSFTYHGTYGEQERVLPIGPCFTAYYWKKQVVRWLLEFRHRVPEKILAVHSSYYWVNEWLLVGMSGQIYRQMVCSCPEPPCTLALHVQPPEALFPTDHEREALLLKALDPEGRLSKGFEIIRCQGTGKQLKEGVVIRTIL